MSEDQFEQFMAAQLAQIALLQSIEMNTGIFMRQATPKGSATHLTWNDARAHLDAAMKHREQAPEKPTVDLNVAIAEGRARVKKMS